MTHIKFLNCYIFPKLANYIGVISVDKNTWNEEPNIM